MEKQRYAFIDVLRVIACFLVIVNHTNSTIFLESAPSPTWFVSIAYFYISKVAVPIFVMISGFTMLDRQDNYKKIMTKVMRAVAALVIFSLLYYINAWHMGTRTDIGIKDFFVSVFQEPQTNALWYMYLYVGILIMLPFIQKFVSALNKKDIHIFFGISIIVYSIWPIVEHICPSLVYSKCMSVPLFDAYICLLLAGYYFKKYLQPSKKILLFSIAGFVAGLLFNIIMTYFEFNKTGGANYLFYDNRVYFPIVLQSICIFYIVSQIPPQDKIAKVLKVIGGCTFGIYLISDFFIEKTFVLFENLRGLGWHPIFAVLIFEVVVFALGLITTFVLKFVPGLKKIL